MSDTENIENVIESKSGSQNENTNEIIEYIRTNGEMTDSIREILARSVLFYNGADDAVPFVYFGTEYPLYIYAAPSYADTFDYVTGRLYYNIRHRAKIKMFSMTKIKESTIMPFMYQKQHEFTGWHDRKGGEITLLYVALEAEDVLKNIYSDEHGIIQPAVFCTAGNIAKNDRRCVKARNGSQIVVGKIESRFYGKDSEDTVYYANEKNPPDDRLPVYRRKYRYL
ncbi:MAG: hypothetical protein IIZ59_04365 [Clostridia bacterium]|nr:hypothetical protein [Clostridia bacterium]